MRYIKIAIITLVLIAPTIGRADVFPLFHIGKNTNENRVVYSAQLTETCKFDDKTPIAVYWERLEKGPDVTRDLKWIEEKFAYGVDILERTERSVTFTIAADDTRPVQVEIQPAEDTCIVEATTKILERWVAPRFAFVKLKERKVMFPKVYHVDLHGIDPVTREAVCERVVESGKLGYPCPKD